MSPSVPPLRGPRARDGEAQSLLSHFRQDVKTEREGYLGQTRNHERIVLALMAIGAACAKKARKEMP
jgi:hypothetical protein